MADTLVGLFEQAVRRSPTGTAIRFEGQSTSYAQLHEQARDVARGLVGAGVAKGTRVALLMANRPEWVAAAFGVWMAGGVLVPVSTFATETEREHILVNADAAVLLVQRALGRHAYLDDLVAAHPEIRSDGPGRLFLAGLPSLRRVFALGLMFTDGAIEAWSVLRAHGSRVPDTLLDGLRDSLRAADDAVVIHTSGTMKEPKGVLHAHHALALQAKHFAASMGVSGDERVWTTQPFFWVAGLAVSLGATLVGGGTLVLEDRFEPAAALSTLESERVTLVRAWPHQERAMADHPDAQTRDLSSIHKVNFASPLAKLAGLTSDEWGTNGGYGLSETCTVVTDLPATAPAELRARTSGLPLPGAEVRIIDPDTGSRLAADVEGEILVRGPMLMRGYLGKLHEETFDADGFFHTGDGGFLDADGYLHWTCRLSAMIKTGGANVAPAEVEAVALAHPGVRMAVALGVPDTKLGEVVALCVVPTDGAVLDEAALLVRLREALAVYKVPKHVLVVAADDIPRTGSEKVRLGALRELVMRYAGVNLERVLRC